MSLIANFQLILRRPQVAKMMGNLGWLLTDKAIRLGVGLVVGVTIARHLGPSYFGQLNYALALVGLLNVFANLGLDSIVQRDLIQQAQDKRRILGTCILLKIGCGVLCYLALLGIIFTNRMEGHTRAVCLIVGLTIISVAGNTFDFWFQSQLLAKYSTYAQNLAFATASAARLGLVFCGGSITGFAWMVVFESLLGVLLFAAYYQSTEGEMRAWSFDPARAKRWLHECWPQLLANLAIMVYMRIDQVMLGSLLNERSVGIYSVAVRISEIGYFIPMMLASTLLPSISRSREGGTALYEQRRQHYFDLSSVLAFALIIPCSLLAGPFVRLLYGPAYQESISILLVHIWTSIFVFLGVARGQYLLLESRLKFSFYATVGGALINVALNFVLIPAHGGLGAAWATLIAQATASFFSSFLYAPVVAMGRQQWRSLNLPLAVHRLISVR